MKINWQKLFLGIGQNCTKTKLQEGSILHMGHFCTGVKKKDKLLKNQKEKHYWPRVRVRDKNRRRKMCN